MPFKFVCPNPDCATSYTVADQILGRIGCCKKCGTKFPLVPATVAPNPASTDPNSFAMPAATGGRELPSPFGRYKILRTLGEGGMGTVYLAHDTELDRQVALKVPHIAFAEHPEVRERFLREARAAARFHHPNFCPIHDIGQVDGIPYLTMAFIEGRTLAAAIEPSKPWLQERAVEVVRQLAIALAEAHRQGVIHRDLKPANVMVDPRGRLVLMDFGLARRFDSDDATFTAHGAILGTPAYMPPEQAEGNNKAVGPHSDIYSLGVILYELLTGRRPYEGSAVRVLAQILMVDPVLPSDHNPAIDSQLEAICLMAMAKKGGYRHRSMEELAGDLEAWLKNKEQELHHSLKSATANHGQNRETESHRVTEGPKSAIYTSKKLENNFFKNNDFDFENNQTFYFSFTNMQPIIFTATLWIGLVALLRGGYLIFSFRINDNSLRVDYHKESYFDELESGAYLSFFASANLLLMLVLGVHRLYETWRFIEKINRKNTIEEVKLPSPRLAVGLLFVPIFGLFWSFVAFFNLSQRVNFHLSAYYPSIRLMKSKQIFCACVGLLILAVLIIIAFPQSDIHKRELIYVISPVAIFCAYWLNVFYFDMKRLRRILSSLII